MRVAKKAAVGIALWSICTFATIAKSFHIALDAQMKSSRIVRTVPITFVPIAKAAVRPVGVFKCSAGIAKRTLPLPTAVKFAGTAAAEKLDVWRLLSAVRQSAALMYWF